VYAETDLAPTFFSFFAGTFPEANQAAAAAVSSYRESKLESDPSAEISSVENHIVGLAARIEP
jgi:hypothetical protein